MGFWTRMFSAVVCWFLSVLVLIAIASHYIIPFSGGLGSKILIVLAAAMCTIAVAVGVLYFWMWVWTRDYWG